MGMNWIKQIFGIKPNEEWPDGPSVIEIMGENHKI